MGPPTCPLVSDVGFGAYRSADSMSVGENFFVYRPSVSNILGFKGYPSSPTRPREMEEETVASKSDGDDGSSVKEIVKAVEIVERDSMGIAESYTSLFSSLRLALSQVTGTSVEHMQCFNDAAGRLQESALDASTRGNRYIHSCLRLNEEMKGIENLAMRLKMLRRSVDTLDSAVNKLTRLP